MLPTVLIVGFAIGLSTQRPRTLIAAIIGLGLFWAALIAIGADDGLALVLAAFGLGAANASVGVLAGALPWLVVERLWPAH